MNYIPPSHLLQNGIPGKNRSAHENPNMSIAEKTWMGKSGAEMTPEEWEACKAYMDAQRATQGKPPIDWSTVGQPEPLTEADIAWAKEVFKRYGLDRS